jgi:hypothetical protein
VIQQPGGNPPEEEGSQMKIIKMLGLAVVATVVATAFLGASSAAAHTICKSNHPLDECPVGDRYTLPVEISSTLVSGTNAVLLSSVGNVTCKKSEVKGKITGNTGESVLGEITSVTFTECKLGSTACTVTTENVPYTAHLLLAIEKVTEPADLGGGTFQQHYHLVVLNGKAHVECGAFINCKFGAPEILFRVRPLATDSDLLVLQELEREGGFCPATSTWHAQYLLLGLEKPGVSTPIFPAAGPLHK